MRSLWPRYTLLPAAPFVLWCSYCLLSGERRWELVLLLVGIPLLAYTNATTKRLYGMLLPFGLVGLIYDAMRFVKHVGVSVERVHVCDLQRYESALFGSHGRTVHDWLQPRAATALDLFFALPYGMYLAAPIGYALYLYFRDYQGAQRIAWTFFVLNVTGFIAHHVYPAAPPWYFHAHGCTVDLATVGNPGPNLVRVDAMLGIEFFKGLYGRSNDVFGALPSLHVAYPAMMLMEGWSKHRAFGRSLLIAFAISMCGAAVYLDHHWIIDVVAGLIFAVIGYSFVHSAVTTDAPLSAWWARRRNGRSGPLVSPATREQSAERAAP
jgi:membrane-associated phospholipid phosphatase